MAYETILFDMDGVLLTGYHTDPDVYRQAAAATLADFGIDYDGVPPGLVRPDDVAEIRTTCDDLGLAAAPAWAYRERAATDLENERIVAGDRVPFEDTAVLSALAGDRTLAIVSNNRQGTVRFAADYFDWPVEIARGRYPTLSEFGRRKPDGHLLRWTLDRLGTDDALFVGDRRSDVEAAHRVGIDTALLSRDDVPDGDPEPTHHIESLSELPDLL
ncbi:HAD superfamily hydrolase [Halapricum desulfuricans]|uniref:HAD superfamily hydrolase n=1 Tax=Halapricum desulfuricans TaxID=2841257 RepID=A0A897NJT1_9EURY|nr:HAD-IA family hydrolase [Halapricum desulfuricans]QSG12908.1 HAD superfamily hydrolase [Halapricum desulfuricans]